MATLPLTVSKDEIEASLCRDSFFDFVQRFWGQIIPERPVWNWHIEFLCHELQTMAERVFRREPKEHDLIINISPGTTKSTICTIMFPAWCWTRDPTIHTICGSYSSPLSEALAVQCRRVMLSDKYQHLFPQVQIGAEAIRLMENTRGGQRISTSTGGTITGMHGHLIIIDDPLNPKEAVSPTVLRTTNEWFDHTLMTRKIDRAITPVILIMQRLHQTDPTGHLLERKEGTPIRHICLPCNTSYKIRPRVLKDRYVDGLFDPVRLSSQVLQAAKAELGTYAFAGQYGQSPIPMGGGLFKADLLRVEGSSARLVSVVRYWDKAGTISKGACFTVGVKMGRDTDRTFWVQDVVRGQWEAAERERIIKQTAEIDGREIQVVVEQEPGSGGKESAQGTIKNLAGWRVRADRPVGDKELRADPYAVQVNAGNVRLVRGEWNRQYIDELAFFPFSTFKDQVDASSGAFAMLTKGIHRVGGAW